MQKISFQGERGAYSESAVRTYFDDDIEVIPCKTFSDAIQNTENDSSQFTILPIENSLEGSVGESYDLLFSTRLLISGEIYHRINHCLISSGSMSEIDTVYSHPQALGQCRKFIQENSLKTVPTYDTAGSVKIIQSQNAPNISCIASKSAAEIYNMPIIKEGIEDNSNNYTRFLVLSKSGQSKIKSDKTSIIFSIKHEAGALFHIIKEFYDSKINLTKIESRPNKNTPWEYNFFVDFEGDSSDENIISMLKRIGNHSSFLKILGSYPSAKNN